MHLRIDFNGNAQLTPLAHTSNEQFQMFDYLTGALVIIEHLGSDSRSSKCSTGLLAKNCGTRYNCRLLKPNPFKIKVTVAVPTPPHDKWPIATTPKSTSIQHINGWGKNSRSK